MAREAKATNLPFALTEGDPLKPLPACPNPRPLIRIVSVRRRSRTYTCGMPVSEPPATRLLALETNATRLPSPLMLGASQLAFASPPRSVRLTRAVIPVCRSRANTFSKMLVSLSTRFVAKEAKATNRPFALIAADTVGPFAGTPPSPTLTNSVGSAKPAAAVRPSSAARNHTTREERSCISRHLHPRNQIMLEHDLLPPLGGGAHM